MKSWFPMGLALLVVVLLVSPAQWSVAADPGDETVPVEITIDGISHWFGPVEFPHEDHVDLVDDCSDCHHHQDADDSPMACSDCHLEEFDPSEPEAPTLLVAQHQRCVGCHKTEDDGPVTCVECHKRAALPEGVPLGSY